MSKKLFFGLILSASGKILLLPGFWRQKPKTGMYTILEDTRKAPSSTICIFVSRLFGNRDLNSQKFQKFEKNHTEYVQIAIKILFLWQMKIKKTSDQLIFVHIFRKKYFKTNLENFMSESLNATSTPLSGCRKFEPLPRSFPAKLAKVIF